jgi:hypothetical protein
MERLRHHGGGTPRQHEKQNILFDKMSGPIAHNLFCTGIAPRIAV